LWECLAGMGLVSGVACLLYRGAWQNLAGPVGLALCAVSVLPAFWSD
jgi:hypothetical protein